RYFEIRAEGKQRPEVKLVDNALTLERIKPAHDKHMGNVRCWPKAEIEVKHQNAPATSKGPRISTSAIVPA
ncbi:MAG: hypothetical protein WCF79_19905, partial [Rhodomicrobium sp.]